MALERKASAGAIAATVGSAADAVAVRETLVRLDDAWDRLTDENRSRLVRLLVDHIVADAAGELHIHLAELARAEA
jgi:hypothetical protein